MNGQAGPVERQVMSVARPMALEEELAECRRLRALAREVDSLLEVSLRERDSLARTFQRLLPELLRLTEARGAALSTRNEELVEQTFHAGDFGGTFPGTLLASAPGVRRVGEGTVVSQVLDVAGTPVGRLGLFFPGDHSAPEAAARLVRLLDTVAEQLDSVLVQLHTAHEKQDTVLQINHLLSNPVFEAGMDQVVLLLAQRVRVRRFLILFRDAVRPEVLHYRTYQGGHLEHDSGLRPSPALEELVRTHGPELLSPQDGRLRALVGEPRALQAGLGIAHGSRPPLGCIVLGTGEEGFSAYTVDLVRVLAAALSQRLADHQRERIHLSQFFPARVIDELLRDPDYSARYLASRDEEVGILFADINGFTRLCERGLESPHQIGHFVDRWSERVVELVWEHGGTFDKMVGDCVIGLFGPPFFRTSRRERAEALVRVAWEIQRYTAMLGAEPEVEAFCKRAGLPGLGVAIGVNLAQTFCGLFGPNQDYTGFSTGMNQTARLQSLASFRETLVMQSVRQALQGSEEPLVRTLRFGPLQEAAVKNVGQPLRYHRLLTPEQA